MGSSRPKTMKTTVDANASLNQPAGAPRHLLITTGGSLRVHPIPASGEVLFGRAAECQVVLDHVKVSRHHARLLVGDRCTVEDLGSRNGTIVRGHRLAANEPREVHSG